MGRRKGVPYAGARRRRSASQSIHGPCPRFLWAPPGITSYYSHSHSHSSFFFHNKRMVRRVISARLLNSSFSLYLCLFLSLTFSFSLGFSDRLSLHPFSFYFSLFSLFMSISLSLFQLFLYLPPQHIVMVACGSAHSIAVTSLGRLYTWGSNARGQLGLDRTPAESFSVKFY